MPAAICGARGGVWPGQPDPRVGGAVRHRHRVFRDGRPIIFPGGHPAIRSCCCWALLPAGRSIRTWDRRIDRRRRLPANRPTAGGGSTSPPTSSPRTATTGRRSRGRRCIGVDSIRLWRSCRSCRSCRMRSRIWACSIRAKPSAATRWTDSSTGGRRPQFVLLLRVGECRRPIRPDRTRHRTMCCGSSSASRSVSCCFRSARLLGARLPPAAGPRAAHRRHHRGGRLHGLALLRHRRLPGRCRPGRNQDGALLSFVAAPLAVVASRVLRVQTRGAHVAGSRREFILKAGIFGVSWAAPNNPSTPR